MAAFEMFLVLHALPVISCPLEPLRLQILHFQLRWNTYPFVYLLEAAAYFLHKMCTNSQSAQPHNWGLWSYCAQKRRRRRPEMTSSSHPQCSFILAILGTDLSASHVLERWPFPETDIFNEVYFGEASWSVSCANRGRWDPLVLCSPLTWITPWNSLFVSPAPHPLNYLEASVLLTASPWPSCP